MYLRFGKPRDNLASRTECCGTSVLSSLKLIKTGLAREERSGGGGELDPYLLNDKRPSLVSYLFNNSIPILFFAGKVPFFV